MSFLSPSADSRSENSRPGDKTGDRAGKAYWDDCWNTGALPRAINPRDKSLDNHINIRIDREFRRILNEMRRSELRGRPLQVLEIGCARSRWLPYFAAEFGCVVTGLDYSEIGCQQAREILVREGVQGSVICANLFDPPAGMIGVYDLVFSAGVVEHFQDTAACLSSLGRFLRPGGRTVTLIPNLSGLAGWIQKRINRAVFDVHVPLTRKALQKAHSEVGLVVRDCRYFLPVGFVIMNLSGLDRSRPSYQWKWHLHNELHRLSKLVWLFEQRAGLLPGSRLLSPYILCVSETTTGTSRKR